MGKYKEVIMPSRIREAVIYAMKKRGVNQITAAKAIGVSHGHLSLFVSGKTGLSMDKLDSLFEFLNIRMYHGKN